MFSIATADAGLSAPFAPIGLAALNAKADMLTRLDNKYIVTAAAMRHAISPLADRFDMLQIDDRRIFDYQTCYFDSPDLRSYFDHHQGRRKRAKIRMREYCGTDLCFVEIKLKDKRGITIKKRLRQDPAKFGRLDAEALTFLHDTYRAHYDEPLTGDLMRILDMRYRRMTLVAKSGGERMTIDGNLQFFGKMSDRALAYPAAADRFILETKSCNGHGIADRILRRLQIHPTKRVSKYCVGMALTRPDIRDNRFLPALRRLSQHRPVKRAKLEGKTA